MFRHLDFRSFVAAAAKAGFRGITLGMDMYLRARSAGFSHGDMRAMLEEHGVEIEYVDGLVHWVPGTRSHTTVGAGVPVDYDAKTVVETASAMGVGLVNAVEVFGAVAVDAAPEVLAAICDMALPHGIRICLEFTPIGTIRDLRNAYEIVARAGRPNLGILFDTFHFKRGGSALREIVAVPAERYFALQLSDTPPAPATDLFKEALSERRLPGQGSADIAPVLQALYDHGVRLPYDAEVMAADLAVQPADEVMALTLAAMRSVLPRAVTESRRD